MHDDASPAPSIRRLANQSIRCQKSCLPCLPSHWALANSIETQKAGQKRGAQPHDLLGTHHQEAHGDCALGSGLQFGHDQVQRIFSLASAKHAFHFIEFELISKQLLLVLRIPLLVLGWPA